MDIENIITTNIDTFARIFEKCVNKAGMLLEEIGYIDTESYLKSSGLLYAYVSDFCEKYGSFDLTKFMVEEFSSFITEVICEEV